MTICPSCGTTIAPEARQCPACGALVPQSVAAPPAAAGAAPVSAQYASIADRLVATLADGLFCFAAFWAVGMWLAPALGGTTATGFEVHGTPALIVIGLTVLAVSAYYICLEWWFGATLGKVVAGVRITGVDGGRIDLRRSLIRNAMRLIDGIGVYLVAAVAALVSKRQQRLGDMLAQTVVVKQNYTGIARAAALLGLVVLVIGTVAGSFMLRRAPAGPGVTAGAAVVTSSTRTSAGSIPAGAGRETAGALAGTLTVRDVRLAAGDEGPERPSGTFKPGESPTLLFNLTSFAIDRAGKARLRLSLTATDPDGVPIIPEKATEMQPEVQEGRPLNSYAGAPLPDFAMPGTYQLRLTVADLAGNHQISTTVPFTVEGLTVEPSKTLTLRNFRLTETKYGATRPDASYRVGSEVWMAFNVIGFMVGTDGAVAVREDLDLRTTSGTLIAQAEGIFNISQRYFYAPRQFPANTKLTLGRLPPGSYEARLTFTDGIGNQKYDHVVQFTIQP
jgi:uncharacterized RDD family membrane protein YckC